MLSAWLGWQQRRLAPGGSPSESRTCAPVALAATFACSHRAAEASVPAAGATAAAAWPARHNSPGGASMRAGGGAPHQASTDALRVTPSAGSSRAAAAAARLRAVRRMLVELLLAELHGNARRGGPGRATNLCREHFTQPRPPPLSRSRSSARACDTHAIVKSVGHVCSRPCCCACVSGQRRAGDCRNRARPTPRRRDAHSPPPKHAFPASRRARCWSRSRPLVRLRAAARIAACVRRRRRRLQRRRRAGARAHGAPPAADDVPVHEGSFAPRRRLWPTRLCLLTSPPARSRRRHVRRARGGCRTSRRAR